ncbi:MAG: prepilin-type N-terminal cleavage/methylation domain-containing protein [Planctomycetes bacterium]|nr:prepilin-type N-terminal cleavage/methylation domain-containing protein [Planctomycetota bacterium]
MAEAPARGFTLVELLVALALAAIISMTIMIISNTAREIYEGTMRKVELSNRFRLALLTMDRDFSQWIDTPNLEFFADGRGGPGTRINRQWDEGEEFPDTTDELGQGVVDGGIPNTYDEFAYILERHYTGVDTEVSPDVPENRKRHDAYQAYFRTFTYVDGEIREANVEYMLVDPNRMDSNGNPQPPVEVIGKALADLVLIKLVRYHAIAPRQLQEIAKNFPIKRRRVEVSSNVTDFKVEYTVENRFYRTSGGIAFRTPKEDYESPSEPETQPQLINDPQVGPMYKKTFGYGSNRITAQYAKAYAYKARQGDRQPQGDHRPVRFGWITPNAKIQFAELTQGSKIFAFTPANRGQIRSGPTPLTRQVQWVGDLYTVRANMSGLLEFYEDVDSTNWQSESQGPILYKAAFLPSAIRITMRVVDDRGEGATAKTMQRVVWIRRKAR